MGALLVFVMVMVRLIPVVEASLPACLLTCPMVSVRSASLTTWPGLEVAPGVPVVDVVAVVPVVVVGVSCTITGPTPGVLAATVPDWMVGVTLLVLPLPPQAANSMSMANAPHSFKIKANFFRDNTYIAFTHFSLAHQFSVKIRATLTYGYEGDHKGRPRISPDRRIISPTRFIDSLPDI